MWRARTFHSRCHHRAERRPSVAPQPVARRSGRKAERHAMDVFRDGSSDACRIAKAGNMRRNADLGVTPEWACGVKGLLLKHVQCCACQVAAVLCIQQVTNHNVIAASDVYQKASLRQCGEDAGIQTSGRLTCRGQDRHKAP
jgi:hypothetical protein